MRALHLWHLALLLAALILVGTTASAQQAGYSLSWATVAGGGASSGGTYTMAATLTQPDVGPAQSGGAYMVAGGVWGAPVEPRRLYLPALTRH